MIAHCDDKILECIKYTDNRGNAVGTADCISATSDYIWIPSEYEVFGETTYSNPSEANYQMQYKYYMSGNSKQMYKSSDLNSLGAWWLRSPSVTYADRYCASGASPSSQHSLASISFGFAPIFMV